METTPSDTKGIKYEYDLFVVGAGSGGVRASRIAARAGARVAVAVPRFPTTTAAAALGNAGLGWGCEYEYAEGLTGGCGKVGAGSSGRNAPNTPFDELSRLLPNFLPAAAIEWNCCPPVAICCCV